MLKRLLLGNKNSTLEKEQQKGLNRDRLIEKLDFLIKQLPDPAKILTDDQVTTLSQRFLKSHTSIFSYLFRFTDTFSPLIPSFIQLISNKREKDAFSKFMAYPGKREEEGELYKRLLEIERQEHKRDVEALNAGLMQAESEIQMLKSENMNTNCMADVLKRVIYLHISENSS